MQQAAALPAALRLPGRVMAMWGEHDKNDDGDSDGGSGTTDGHDHFEEEDDDE